MQSTRVLTQIRDGVLADALYEDGRLRELSLQAREQSSILGNIYIGKVKNIVKNIQAAFVEVEGGLLCYLPFEEIKNPIYTRPKKQEKLAEGDELLVQVTREAVKTKAPSVSTNLNLTGKYMVLTTGNAVIGVSAKLKPEEKERLRSLAESLIQERRDSGKVNTGEAGFGLVMRTNGAGASDEEITAEFDRLMSQYEYLTSQAVHLGVFSCVKHNRPAYLNTILGSRSEQLKEIVTDEKELYDEIRTFLSEEVPEDLKKLRFYEDRQLSMKALYRMEKDLSEALSIRVWLKCGGYLVIEQTEALTVIDVNTGKFTSGKDKEKTIKKLNQEAAEEIARQMRLRNLSGIILVDFVDMAKKEDDQWLLHLMQEHLKSDPMKGKAVDMTSLGLMEITRKKQKKTLLEQAKECRIS